MGEYRTRFLLHKFSLKSNITVHCGIITPVYNEFYTPVPMCRDPVFGHENHHFCENQAKTLVFIPNLAQSRLCKGLVNPSPGPWDEWQEAEVK
jgi:hypothetical protein